MVENRIVSATTPAVHQHAVEYVPADMDIGGRRRPGQLGKVLQSRLLDEKAGWEREQLLQGLEGVIEDENERQEHKKGQGDEIRVDFDLASMKAAGVDVGHGIGHALSPP